MVALDGVDLTVMAGELVAVMGPSGSGKSTLLSIAGGLDAPSAGEAWLNGNDMWGVGPAELAALRRRSIGYVFQEFNLLAGLTAAENVAAPLELDGVPARRAEPEARRRLDEVGLGGKAMAVGFIRVALPLTLAGIIAALVGLLMLSPAAVKMIGRGAGGLPLPVRLAARAIARLQGRSAAVVSALVIALGVPAGLAVASAAIDDRDRRAEDNLPDHMAILWLPGAEQSTPEIPAELDAAAAARSLDRATAAVPGARVAPIEVAVDPRLG